MSILTTALRCKIDCKITPILKLALRCKIDLKIDKKMGSRRRKSVVKEQHLGFQRGPPP